MIRVPLELYYPSLGIAFPAPEVVPVNNSYVPIVSQEEAFELVERAGLYPLFIDTVEGRSTIHVSYRSQVGQVPLSNDRSRYRVLSYLRGALTRESQRLRMASHQADQSLIDEALRCFEGDNNLSCDPDVYNVILGLMFGAIDDVVKAGKHRTVDEVLIAARQQCQEDIDELLEEEQ